MKEGNTVKGVSLYSSLLYPKEFSSLISENFKKSNKQGVLINRRSEKFLKSNRRWSR